MPATIKLSGKHQIVVPKAVRQKMHLTSGTRVSLHPIDEKHAILLKQPAEYTTALKGLGREVWKSLGGGDKYIKQERALWKK